MEGAGAGCSESAVEEDSVTGVAGAAAAGAGAGIVGWPVGGKGAGAPPIRRFRAGASEATGAEVCPG